MAAPPAPKLDKKAIARLAALQALLGPPKKVTPA